MGLAVDSYLLPTSKSRDSRTGIKNQKSGPDKLQVLPPNLGIGGHLPAPIVNGGRDSLWKWPNFRLSKARNLDLDLKSGHTAYRHASLVDLYLHTKFHWNRRNCLWTDGWTYVRTGKRTRPTIIRSTRRSRPEKVYVCYLISWWVSCITRHWTTGPDISRALLTLAYSDYAPSSETQYVRHEVSRLQHCPEWPRLVTLAYSTPCSVVTP